MKVINCDGYHELINCTMSFIKSIEVHHTVSWCETKNLAETVFELITSKDMASIIQMIHSTRTEGEGFIRHCSNVSILNGLMGAELQLSNEDIKALIAAGLLHDVGKVTNLEEKDDLLLKKEDFDVIKNHPVTGYDLLCQEDDFDERIKSAIKQHHERIDGSGYPKQLKGNEISFFAKITSITDGYDKMVAEKSRDKFNPFLCLSQFEKEELAGLDQALSATFIRQIAMSFRNKRVFLSDKTIGTIMLILPNDLEHPIVHVHGTVKQTSERCHCMQLVINGEEEQSKEVI